VPANSGPWEAPRGGDVVVHLVHVTVSRMAQRRPVDVRGHCHSRWSAGSGELLPAGDLTVTAPHLVLLRHVARTQLMAFTASTKRCTPSSPELALGRDSS